MSTEDDITTSAQERCRHSAMSSANSCSSTAVSLRYTSASAFHPTSFGKPNRPALRPNKRGAWFHFSTPNGNFHKSKRTQPRCTESKGSPAAYLVSRGIPSTPLSWEAVTSSMETREMIRIGDAPPTAIGPKRYWIGGASRGLHRFVRVKKIFLWHDGCAYDEILITARQGLRHRNFLFRIFGERHANRVADAVLKKASDPGGGLDPSVFSVSGFGDAQMKRIRPSPLRPCAAPTNDTPRSSRAGSTLSSTE